MKGMLGFGVVAGLLATSAMASTLVDVVLVNPSFEQPVGGAAMDSIGTVPGWFTRAGSVISTGVATASTGDFPYAGSQEAYMVGSDPAIYQTTNYALNEGDVMTLSGYARRSWWGYQIALAMYGVDGGGNESLLVSQSFVLPGDGANPGIGPYAQVSLSYTALAADVGKNVRIEFKNATGANNMWLDLDAVSLQAATTVPEPMSAGIVGLACAGLLMSRRTVRTKI